MEPFFFLHADLQEMDGESRSTQLSLFGKDAADRAVVVRIHNYRIKFYVSFRDVALCRYCCKAMLENNTDRLVLGIQSCYGFHGMLLQKSHQVADSNDYANTALSNVIILQVRRKNDVQRAIKRIDDAAYKYYADQGWCDGYFSATNYYQSNLDVIASATRSLGLDACRWCYLNTDACDKVDDPLFVGLHYSFHDNGARDPNTLFVPASSNATVLPTLPPRMKILSFDIECLSSDVESMPDMERDPVIQISSVVSTDALGLASAGDGSVSTSTLFTLGGTCAGIPGVSVYTFREESDMLAAFVDHLHDQDPDILTGYNINNFDLPYLFKRMELKEVGALIGRGRVVATCTKRAQEVGRQYASFVPKQYDTKISGRVCFDMYTHLRKEVVLRCYKLNSVSSHFLGQQKDDVGYKMIPALFNGDECSRARLGQYCVKDARLVLDLVFKTQTFVHSFERCKVFRTMLQYLVDRGQQMKFYSMLLAWCSARKILVNDVTTQRRLETARRASAEYEIAQYNARGKRKTCDQSRENRGKRFRSDDDGKGDRSLLGERDTCAPTTGEDGGGKTKRAGYDGATVLEPVTGIYHTPVLCLDYASLYPSIMIGYNLCFTTLVLDKNHGRDLVDSGLAEQSPVGHYFLKGSVKKGVLPSILEMLTGERTEVRKRMAKTSSDSIEYSLFDGQQSALKIAANSIYGAIGCNKSILNFVEIPSSVTAYGRQLILHTKEYVERNYRGTSVVYGDTDSVMVNLSTWDSQKERLWKCVDIGKEMANSITESIQRTPIRLQFETVYRPFLLCTKKRYAAGVYGDLEKMVTGDSADQEPTPTIKYKGLQVVRRDNCRFSTRLMRFVLEALMYCKPLQHITDGLRDELSNLFDGRVDMEELIISKELKRQKCDTISRQAHDRLVARMRSRDPNSAPCVGERVPYLVIAGHSKLCDRAEDPVWVRDKNLPLDFMYYAENQVAKPIADLLAVALRGRDGEGISLEDIKDSFWPAQAPRRSGDKRCRPHWTTRAAVGNRRITDYMKTTT